MTIYVLILLFSTISHFIPNSNGQLQTENFSYETITKIQQLEFIFKNILNEQFFQDFVRNITSASKLSPDCEQTINSTLSNAKLIEQLIDSAGKPGPGILNGNKFWTGDYDTCKKLDGMLYATLSFSISILPVSWGFCLPEACSSSNDTTIMITYLFNSTIAIKFVKYQGLSISRSFMVGVGETITAIILSIFACLAFLSTMYVFISKVIDHFNSLSPESSVSKLRKPFWQIPINVAFASKALNSYSESYGSDINQNALKVEEDKQNPEMTKLLKSNESKSYKSVFTQYLDNFAEPFSLYTNIETIFDTEQPPSAIKCLNGIRVLSMFWVILCHGFLVLVSVAQNPLTILGPLASRYSAQPIINGYFAVDTFFVLSGFLVMYLSLRELSRIKKGFSNVLIFLLKFYIHRILRITPTLFIFMLFFWKIAKFLGDGPFWDGIVISKTDLCDTTWWQVILYINNIFSNNMNSCINWTWYLANDMQFFIISPLFILPAHFIPFPIPFVPIIIAILISLIPTFSLLSVYNIRANTFFPSNHLNDGLLPSLVNATKDSDFDIYYTKPYIRISPYLVGLALGYLIYKISIWKTLTGDKRALNIRLAITSLASWPISIICCYGLVHGLYSSYHGHVFTHFENIIYLGVSRTLWGVGLALFIYICYNGYGGPINAFLSMGFWVPLSRLTFSAYLVHPIIIMLFYLTLRQPFYYSDMAFAFITVGFVVMSYGAAAIMAVFIEFPLAKLEDLVLKRKKKK